MSGIEDLIRVYRGTESNLKPDDIKYNFGRRYFSTNKGDAIDYATRKNTLKGKVKYLDLTPDEFQKARNLSKNQLTRLSEEVIVDPNKANQAKMDFLKTIQAKSQNLSKLALKGLSKLSSLPVAMAMTLISPGSLNEGEDFYIKQLEELGKNSSNIDKSISYPPRS